MLTRLTDAFTRKLLSDAGRQQALRAWHLLRLLGFLYLLRAAYLMATAPSRMWGVEGPVLRAFWPLVGSFVLITVIDWAIGLDRSNLSPDLRSWLARARLLNAVPILVLPAHVCVLVAGAHFVTEAPNVGWIARFGWTISCGVATGFIAISAAHELLHRPSRFDRLLSGLLLSLACYGTFKVEHVRGHHVDVATPNDPSSAELGRSIYGFIPRAIVLNILKAWRIEREVLLRRGLNPIGWHNELIWWTAVSGACAATLAVAFGPLAAAFFFLQALAAIVLLESINYVQHYGLRRRRLANGDYEPVSAIHAWEAPYLASSWFMLNLQRHADHHMRAARPYHLLDCERSAPTLPASLPGMVVLAYVPFLWRRVMNQRVPASTGGAPEVRGPAALTESATL